MLGLWCLTPLSTTIVIGTNKRNIFKFVQCNVFFIYVLKGTLKMFLHTAGVKHQPINQSISLIN
jgi:hypothetical protein